MRTIKKTLAIVVVAGAMLGGLACSPPAEEAAGGGEEYGMKIADDVAERLGQFAPVELAADLSGVPESELPVLRELAATGPYMDAIFLRQVWRGNPALLAELEALEGEKAAAALEYFRVNFGPWDRLIELEPFIGDKEHPLGAGYYPEDLTREEFEAWVEAHPDDRNALESLTTVVHRGEDGLYAVPYSEEYAEWLTPAAEHLRAAAAMTGNDSLRHYLETRAAAFTSDDYYESDVAWMDLDSPVEVTIGPYETYEDGLFGYKSAFEIFLTVDLPDQSAALARFKDRLPWLERNLPIPEEHKNLDRGTDSPIRVVDIVYTGGDTKAGVQTVAFNLPNDERVREDKGSKKVLLRNILRAKYDRILVPIAERVVATDQVDAVSFDAFMAEVLHHELSHGLGPGKITVDGRETEVRLELKELYSTLEEAKADVMGVYNILALIDEGEIEPEMRATLEPTYVAGLFRAARFGVHEAHGQGVVSQFNYLLEKGALQIDDEGRFAVVTDAFPGGIRDLLHDMTMLQANGDYEGTAEFLGNYGQPSDELLAAIERLADVPVDIRPVYTQAEEMLAAE